MRVLYAHTGRTGGAELAAPALAHRIKATLWVRGDGTVADRARSRGVSVKVLAPRTDQRWTGLWSLVRSVVELAVVQVEMTKILRREHPSQVVSNSIQGLLHLALPCALSKTNLVAYVRDLGDKGNRRKLEVYIYRLIIRLFVRGVIYNSEVTRTSWRIEKTSIIVPTAVGHEFFDVWCGKVSPHGVMLGRIAQWKGQNETVQALNLLASSRPVRFSIVGGRLFGEAVTLPQAQFPLTITDHVDAPWEFLKSAGFLVHASLTPEPFGQVVAQAAASGIPIICSNAGGQMEWLVKDWSCLTVDPRDTQGFSNAIAELLDDPDATAVRSARARQSAERFREENAYVELENWLDDMEWNQ